MSVVEDYTFTDTFMHRMNLFSGTKVVYNCLQ